MKPLPILKPGDSVEIIAPASRCSNQVAAIKPLLESWQLRCVIAEDMFGPDLLCANSDEARFKLLINAIQNPETKAIICARGGYGSMRLIPRLHAFYPDIAPKIFIGMSDITALQLYFQQKWQWPTIHAALVPDRFSPDSIQLLKSFLFGEKDKIVFSQLSPLNQAAEQNKMIDSQITGGNLSLIQAGIGTQWQLEGNKKIILLEEVGERGYRVDRMLEHLTQAGMFKQAVAILLGDFLSGNEPDGTSLIDPILKRFADQCEIPVVRIQGVGHGFINNPIPLGTSAQLICGKEVRLECSR